MINFKAHQKKSQSKDRDFFNNQTLTLTINYYVGY